MTIAPNLDFLLVPGGQGTRREVDNAALVGFIAIQAQHCRAVLSICTGCLPAPSRCLLTGRKATTHWASLDRLRALGDVDVVEERIVHDGKLWSSAGVSAGIDLMLAFIATSAGEDAAIRLPRARGSCSPRATGAATLLPTFYERLGFQRCGRLARQVLIDGVEDDEVRRMK